MNELIYKSEDNIIVPREHALEMLSKYNIIVSAFQKNDQILTLKIAKDSVIEERTKFVKGNTLYSMGSFSYDNGNLGFGVKAGRYCSFAHNVKIMGTSHFTDWITSSPHLYGKEFNSYKKNFSTSERRMRNIHIGNDVWIGDGALLARDITIGNGAIIAAGAIVTKDVPPYAIVGGVPAKVIRYKFTPDIISLCEFIKWWEYSPQDLKGLSADKPSMFLEGLLSRIENNMIDRYQPNSITYDMWSVSNISS